MTSDLQSSTALGERLDAESLREILTLYFDDMRQVFESHGGTIEKIIGDAIVAVFGLPTPSDGDALRAVRAAAETQSAVARLNEQLDRRWGVRLINRTGIATGEVVVGAVDAGEHILTGAVLQLANKLEQSAPPTEVLVGERTYKIVANRVTVEPAESVVPEGSSESVFAYRLVSVKPADAAEAVSSPVAQNPDARICSNCGAENPIAFRCCGTCGALLTTRRSQETRKIVTIVFSDLRATTLEGTPLPPAALREVMTRAFEESRQALVRHGGTMEKFIGDAVMAVFGLPVRHEDDALRAVRGALEMRRGLSALAESLDRDGSIHLDAGIGVNTGEVVAGEASLGQRLVTGDAVNVAARLEQAASSLEVLIGHPTYSLVRDVAEVEEVEPLALKGKSQPVRAHRLLAVRSAAATGRQGAAMVGREEEMAVLASAFSSVVSDRVCRMVTLVGDAGVGKTRLTHEFLDSIRANARIVRGRCLPYGDGITFWPIVELVRDAMGLRESERAALALRKLRHQVGDEAVVERVAAAVGLQDAPFQIGELFWGIRRFLEILAAREPLVVAVDDIHWAEPTFIELLTHLTTTAHGGPILLLCTARTELLERQPTWGQGPDQRTIVLPPLSDADAARLTENLLGHMGLTEAVRERVVTAAEGNPLFVEQLVSMLKDTGMLHLVDGRWEPDGDLSGLAIPPTIHALLAARLDELPDGERAVIDHASVIGLVFPELALEAIVEDDVRGHVPERLAALTRRQLVRPHGAVAGDDAEFRFAHLMVRDAAYAGLLKRTRARLHERFVAWADESNRASEFEEILGYHLEQAHRYLSELGPLDDHGAALGINASGRLASAGQRAFVRGDMPATANLVRRAADLLPDGHSARPRLFFTLGLALREVGEGEAADAAFGSAAEGAARIRDVGLETIARLERAMRQYFADPSEVKGDIEAQIRQSTADLERVGDEAWLARAWLSMAGVRMVDARWGAAADAVERVIEHAQRAGDRILEIRAGPNLAMCAKFGPTPVPEAIRLCEAIIARSGDDRKAEAVTLRSLAHLHAMRGDLETARAEYRKSRAMLDELGWRFQAALTSIDSGPVEMLAGDPEAAEAELRRDYQTLDELGDRNYISTVAALLAEALYHQGRYEAADAMASFSAETAAPEDVATQVALRGVRGKLLTRRGRHGEAEALCREAVELSRTEDDPVDQATALSALAHVLRARGKDAEAIQTQTAALDLYEAKGDIVSAAVARASLADIPGKPAPPRLSE